jgi:hypothetical protein
MHTPAIIAVVAIAAAFGASPSSRSPHVPLVLIRDAAAPHAQANPLRAFGK